MNLSRRIFGGPSLPSLVVALGLGSAAVVLADWTASTAGIDDTFITYVFARRFALGQGLTWPASTALGTSSPFLAVVLGVLSRATGFEVPILGNAMSWAAIALASQGLFVLGRREGWPLAGLTAGLLWFTSAYKFFLLGNEYLPAIAAAVWALYARAEKRFVCAGVLLAFGAMFRAEVGLVALFVAAMEFDRQALGDSVRRIAKIAAAAMLVATLWLLALHALSGTIVPRTLAAKRAQHESNLGWSHANPLAATMGTANTVFPLTRRKLWPPLALAGCVTLALGLRERRSAAALVGWGTSHVLLLVALGVPFYDWYAAPFRFATVLLPALAAAPPPSRSRAFRIAWRGAALATITWVAATAIGNLTWLHHAKSEPRRTAYARIAQFAERYPEETRMAALEVGYLGWYSSRPIVDLLGLVSDRASLDAVRRGRLRENLDLLDADLAAITLGSKALFASIVGDPQKFRADFALDHLALNSTPPVVVYRRRTLTGRGEVALDLLADSTTSRKVVIHHAQGVSLLAFELAPSERLELRVPPGPRRTLFTQLTATSRRSRLTLAIEGDTPLDRSEHRRGLDPTHWLEAHWTLPPTASGLHLTFECAPSRRRTSCVIGQPFVGHPEIRPSETPNDERHPKKRRSKRRG